MLTNTPIVIKYGGSLLEDPAHRENFLKDIAALSAREKIVLVHGGGKEISTVLEKRGIAARFVNGLRVTDDATMKIVREVLEEVNKRIVKQLIHLGVRAEGYSGMSNHLLQAVAIKELGRVGKPEAVNLQEFGRVLAKRTLAVFYPVAEDLSGGPLNINADDFALALALACRAKRLVFLTETGGILDAGGAPIAKINRLQVEELIKGGVITGGMMVKARASVDAVSRGVGSVDITKNIKYLLAAGDNTSAATSFSNKKD
jgi:acetylglutamate kinase